MQKASQAQLPQGFRERVRHFAEILNPLFWHDSFYDANVLFEYVCTLVRTGGMQDGGWDAYLESQATLADLKRLADMELPTETFPDAERTRTRLALISYCHLTEMDLPYFLLANLLRVRLGKKYDMRPFRELEQAIGKNGKLRRLKPPTPRQKIRLIKALADAAGLPEVGPALDEIHDSVIRNAVYHSDYVLHRDQLRLLSSFRYSKKQNYLTGVVELDELAGLVNDAFAFYSAFLTLYERARTLLKDFKNAFLPFDARYKGLLELVYDEDKLIGLRAYWPNGSFSEYSRCATGCTAVNVQFDPDGSLNFFVGVYASKPGNFSPLVEHDQEPVYAARPGTDIHPHWPAELQTYKLPAESS